MNLYLDTNAFSYFDAHRNWSSSLLSAARDRLGKMVQSGDVAVYVSYPLLEEVLGLLRFDTEKYTRVMGFLLEVSQFNLLRSTDALAKVEVTTGGSPEMNDRLEPWLVVREVRRRLRKDGDLKSIPPLTEQAFAQFEMDESARRDEALARLEEVTEAPIIHGSRKWWGNAEREIGDWVQSHMARSVSQLGLTEDPSEWPPPRHIPTLWHFYAYRMARIHLNVGEGRRIEGSDLYDAHHYAAAASMDVFVTDDRAFRATCAAIPHQPFALLTFDELLTDRLQELKHDQLAGGFGAI